jgi:NAD(P)-dependent dehydrogenase (short-subunit alcohol dehydrogenase family)
VKDLKARTVIVTGAASGIGSGIARTLARAGMNVALLDIQERVLRAIRDDEFFTHAESRLSIENRHRRIMEAFHGIAEIEHEKPTH